MISTTHITTGAALGLALGSALPEPMFAIPAAFLGGVLSHHFLDMIPHTDTGSWRAKDDHSISLSKAEFRFAILDNIFGTLLILWIFFTREPSWPMLFGAAGGNFPDLFHHVPKWGAAARQGWPAYFALHTLFHRTAYHQLIPLGVLTNLFFIWISVQYLLTA